MATEERFEEMTDAEQDLTVTWFATTDAALVTLVSTVRTKASQASDSEKVDWLRQFSRLTAQLSLMQAAEEAMNASSLVINPPDEPLIDETIRCADALGKVIASANKATAIVRLVDDLSGLIAKVL